MNVKVGSEILLDGNNENLRKRRLGIFTYGNALLSNGEHIVDAFIKKDFNVTALFGPEHGLFMDAEYMIPVKSSVHPKYNIPIFSLYGDTFESLIPTSAMLEKIDVLLFDCQDVGSRYYTYIWSLVLCMKECAKHGIDVIVCDRPNPIGGTLIEGNGIEKGFESFVGLYSLPNRHGLTLCEMANYLNKKYNINAKLEVIKMDGWKREMMWGDTGLKWTNPSPNMRSFNAALLYPGMCLLEGTNISEGRGTDTPFEIIGAPYIDGDEFLDELEKMKLPGVKPTPTTFIPTWDKHEGKLCNGVRWVIANENEAKPYLTGLATIWVINRLYKNKGFEWRTTPYEFVKNPIAIDLLTGSSFFRENIDNDWNEIIKLDKPEQNFVEERSEYLLY